MVIHIFNVKIQYTKMYNDIIKCCIFFYRDSLSLSNFQIVLMYRISEKDLITLSHLRQMHQKIFSVMIKNAAIFVLSSNPNTVLYRLIVVNSKASLFFLLFPFLLFFFQSLILPFCNLQIPPSPPISFFFPSLPSYFSSLFFIYSLQLYP